LTATTIRLLTKEDLPAARRIVSLAFGTFLGAPDPATFWSDLDYVGTRWLADPSAAFGAEIDGELVGSNFATRWGRVGFFGPLTVHPDLWDKQIGRQLMEPIMHRFEEWGVTHAGLFTFAHSPKHLALYQKYGFWPRFLTAIMSKPVTATKSGRSWTAYSELSDSEREARVRGGGELTDALYPGLDVEREIRAVDEQKLGETVLLEEDEEIIALAVCHCGRGTEAGNGTCYVKFAAVHPGRLAESTFERLLDACNSLAAEKGLARLTAGVNMARHETYRGMLEHGFRADFQGVAMHRPNEPAYNRPGVYLIDDWR
jgi:N-acetylglutamate synthase-like GNAT family acetyltransferase